MLTELGDLRRNDGLAIGLHRIVTEVVLMIGLGPVKRCERRQLRDDRPVPELRGLGRLDHLLRDLLLLGRVREDHGPVLRAHVMALAVPRGGIMNYEEYLKKIFIADDTWIERHLHHFRVAGAARADLLVR